MSGISELCENHHCRLQDKLEDDSESSLGIARNEQQQKAQI